MTRRIDYLQAKVTGKIFGVFHGNMLKRVLDVPCVAIESNNIEESVTRLSNIMGDEFGKKSIHMHAIAWKTVYMAPYSVNLTTPYVKVLFAQHDNGMVEYSFYPTKKGLKECENLTEKLEQLVIDLEKAYPLYTIEYDY